MSNYLRGLLATIVLLIFIGCKKDAPPTSATILLGEITFTSNSAKIELNISDDGNSAIMETGIFYKSSAGATSGGTKITSTPSKGKFVIEIPGLKKATKYYITGFATNAVGTTYTQEVSFNTTPEIPILTLQNITINDPISATYGYNITDNGGAALSLSGICWNTTGSPTAADNKLVDTATVIGYRGGLILTLTPNTKYYFRAFATNSVGTSYSSEITYTTEKLNSCFQTPLIINSGVSITRVQSDGKIILGGAFTKLNGKDVNYLIRLNKDGTKDSTFNFTYDMSTSSIYKKNDLKLQGNKMILILNSLTPGSYQTKVIRLNNDGSVDNTFYTGSITSSSPTGSTSFDYDVLPNGKLIFVGNVTNYNGVIVNGLVCINADGTVDNNFTIGKGFDTRPQKVLALPSGKLLIGGYFATYDGVAISNLVRLNADGSIDGTFNSSIKNYYVRMLQYNPAIDKIYVDYDNTATFGSFVRLNSDGSTDNSFSAGSLGPNSGNAKYLLNIVPQQDGKLLLYGAFGSYNGTVYTNNMLRLNTNGSVDNTFSLGSGFSSVNSGFSNGYYTITILDDKSILYGGGFTSYNGAPVKYFVKLNENFTTCGY